MYDEQNPSLILYTLTECYLNLVKISEEEEEEEEWEEE
jgi:hypothetical protein